jgi:hypothetical protein
MPAAHARDRDHILIAHRRVTSVRRPFFGSYQESDPVCVVEGMAVATQNQPRVNTAVY